MFNKARILHIQVRVGLYGKQRFTRYYNTKPYCNCPYKRNYELQWRCKPGTQHCTVGRTGPRPLTPTERDKGEWLHSIETNEMDRQAVSRSVASESEHEKRKSQKNGLRGVPPSRVQGIGFASMPGHPPHLPRASRLCRRVPSPAPPLHLLPPRLAAWQGCRRGLQPRTNWNGTAERLQVGLFQKGGVGGSTSPTLFGLVAIRRM